LKDEMALNSGLQVATMQLHAACLPALT